jgi:stage IV sporulation protein FB
MFELRIRGIEFHLSILFPMALVILLTYDTSGMVMWCVAASAMHEAGHFFALLLFGRKPSLVSVGLFGIRVEQNIHSPLSYQHNLLVSLAGPMVNLVSFAVLYLTNGLTTPAIIHLSLAMLNLLPIEPLDGGQALFCLLALRYEEQTADRLTFMVSIITIIPLACSGFFLLVRSGYNFTLLAVSVYLGLLILFKRKR